MEKVEFEYFGVILIVHLNGTIETKDRIITQRNQYSEYTRTIKGKVLSPRCNGKSGYFQVKICNKGLGKNEYVHRLVWMAFNGEIPEGYEIEHKDDDKSNNALSNLELFTRKQNMGKVLNKMTRDSLGRFEKLN